MKHEKQKRGKTTIGSLGSSLFRPLAVLVGVAVAGGPRVAVLAGDVIAHRGASAEAPENTLASFNLAWEKGADGVEGDFWMTRDGKIVCLHDKTTKRTADRELDVTAASLEELRELDVGAWKADRWRGESIPLLDDVLASIPAGKTVFIEIKDTARAVPAIAEVVRKSKLGVDQVRFIAFDPAVVVACKKEIPKVKINWLLSSKDVEKRGIPGVVEQVVKMRADGIGVDANTKDLKSLADAMRKAGVELHVWTVNDADQARRMKDLGALSITTDKPTMIQKATAEVSVDAPADKR